MSAAESSTQDNPSLPSRSKARRNRLAWMFVALIFAVVLVAGVQGWRIVTAIMDAEQAAVVPLPPSELALRDAGNPPQSWTGRTGANAPVTGNTQPAPPPRENPADLPSQEDSASQAVESGAEQPENLSRLEVAQTLVEAGIANDDPGMSRVWEGREAINILVLGLDRRPDGGDQNADVIIIARLDLRTHRLSAVSVPRDLLVDIPGIGPEKINGSYQHGVSADPENPIAGVSMVRDTIEQAFGIPIDDYVLVDFGGFEHIVDALGGIDVDVPYTILDKEYPTEDYGFETVRFEAGLQRMDGDTALKYVRTRHADSDDARRERQIDVILSILAEGQSLSSLARADELIATTGDAVQTSFTLEEQLTLARLARTLESEQITIVTPDPALLDSGWTEDGRWVYIANLPEMSMFIHDVLYDAA
jgi:polyisoprenyl-teichoic acid--peptidoglycan teichoic acid transferase